MAESRRKADAKKSVKAEPTEAEQAHRTRLERMTLLLYLEGAVAIIVGMIVLSEFLSEGKASDRVWIPAAILGGILLLGVGITWYVRRRARGPTA